MTDIIHLLPDHIANQIAAGEVIQRPGSAVKELLENAVDAGADEITLIVQDAGKTLVQVIDNGKGMSATDARMAFERHATSKINQIEDLFSIKTMGFRGEALASIAAVAQVELKTRRESDSMGTYIEMENSRVKLQEPIAFNKGTSIAMKNLFFNVPARRNFLKSNHAELKHIIDEFIRVAMSFPAVFFSFQSNGQEVFHLEKGTLKQRIVQILGNHYQSKLVQVNEQTDYMNIFGFVGKPETAKKTRGDQYIFVNNRFIKSPYLHHAIMNGYELLIAKDSFPMYALYIDIDPAHLDVNVHPTKQEIKFEDEKIIYAFVHAAIKHALAQFSITPTLDFELDPNIQRLDAVNKPMTEAQRDTASSSSLYRTFTQKDQAYFIERSGNELKHWKDFYEPATATPEVSQPQLEHQVNADCLPEDHQVSQLNDTFIVLEQESGFMLVHQQNAHERILFERYQNAMEGQPIATQQSLFPETFDLSPADATLLQELLPELKALGYQLEPFGMNSFVIQGIPADITGGTEKASIELLLEQYKHFSADMKLEKREKIFRALSSQHAIKAGTHLPLKAMQVLVHDLMQCSIKNISPSGRPTFMTFQKNELDRLFGRG